MSRAFKSIDNQINSGSDYTKSIRNKALYLSIERKVKTEEGANSVSKYDSDYSITWCKGGSGAPVLSWTTAGTAKLKSASSYAAYMNIARGKRLANPVLNGATASKFNIFTGNFAMVHPLHPYPLLVPSHWNTTNNTLQPTQSTIINPPPAVTGVPTQVNTIPFPNSGQLNGPVDVSWNEINYPGWFFDPYGVLSNYTCIKGNAPTLGTKLVNQVEIIYRWSPAYWRSVAGQSMSGAAFPESVTFNKQPTENDNLTNAYGPVASLAAQEGLAGSGDTFTGDVSKIQNEEQQLQSWCIQQGGRLTT